MNGIQRKMEETCKGYCQFYEGCFKGVQHDIDEYGYGQAEWQRQCMLYAKEEYNYELESEQC